MDRLRRQPGAGERAGRPPARRAVRAPQRRQRGGARRSQLPLGDPVRGRRAAGPAHHRRRPFALRRRDGGAPGPPRRPGRQLAALRPGRPQPAQRLAGHGRRGASRRRARRAQRHRSGAPRLRDHGRARRLGTRPGAGRSRLVLRPGQRPAQRPALHRDQPRRRGDGVRRGGRRGAAALLAARHERAGISRGVDRRPRLRHRQGDARRLRPPLPVVSAGEHRSQGALRGGRLARPAARPGAAHRVLRQAGRRGGRAAAARVRGRGVADGRVAAGQAALHRPLDRPQPARACRDLLQLGHDQDPAPQLLPQRLHLRPPGGLDRIHREQRAGGAADLPRLLPDRRHPRGDLAAGSSTTSSWRASSRTWSATSPR